MNADMNERLIEMHIRVVGQVQGVGFRYTTQQFAQKLGLKGTVSNLRDGSVEIFVLGTKQGIDQLLEKLRKSFEDYIQEIAVKEVVPTRSFDAFSILHNS